MRRGWILGGPVFLAVAALAGWGSLRRDAAPPKAPVVHRAAPPKGDDAGAPGTTGLRVCFGAFPREDTRESLGLGITFRPHEGLRRLSQDTSLRIRGTIVYIPLRADAILAFRNGDRAHFLAEKDIGYLTALVHKGAVPRLALEPIGWGGRGPLQRLLSSTDVLTDLASTLAPLGPCSMRVASELNLYDSPYHVPTTSPAAMDQMCRAFAEVHAVFSARAPNVAITFSPFIPNGQTREERRHSLRLIARYLPVLDRHVDMFTGTFYARSPEEVDGLRGYARLVWHTGKPFGIDELGCHDEDTFQTVMDSLVEGRLGEPRFINFFDYHVEKPHVDHPWQLKAADKRLLTRLREQAKIVDG